MIDMAMIWRRDDPGQDGLLAVVDGTRYYINKYGKVPNFVNVPQGFLSEKDIFELQKRKWTVATNAPKYFKNDIWLGIKTQAQNKEKQP